MNEQVKNLSTKLSPLLSRLKRYRIIIYVVVVCGAYGFLAYRISSLTQAEPDPSVVSEKLQTVPRPRVDQQAIDKMKQLEEESIEIQSLFQEARDNPFSE